MILLQKPDGSFFFVFVPNDLGNMLGEAHHAKMNGRFTEDGPFKNVDLQKLKSQGLTLVTKLPEDSFCLVDQVELVAT